MIEKILNRKEYEVLKDDTKFQELKGKAILVTGAKGSVGSHLVKRLTNIGANVLGTDIDTMDVTNASQVKKIVKSVKWDYIIHLAGAKYAPEGEIDSEDTFTINTIGTLNIIKAKRKKTKLILASTCKSCNPETVYGASKLIAERLTLNDGGSVARFFNVIETAGNVFELWKDQFPRLVVSYCNRHFITLDEACGLFLFTCIAEQGRYIVNSPQERNMKDVFDAIYPDEAYLLCPPRRGDRVSEKWLSTCESESFPIFDNSIIKIDNYHDKK
jgi:FlaA1/EpsC-like NDP-sugar epimerase